MVKEYILQAGENFYGLAQRMGCSCEDFIQCNPQVDPWKLQIGQKIVLPEFKTDLGGREQYADIRVDGGAQEFAGNYLDDVEMEIEGVRVRLRRIGEPSVPHEVHFILPRTEIRKIQPAGECGPCEVQIMLSNLNVVLSPRFLSGDNPEQPASAQTPNPAGLQESRQPTQSFSQTAQQGSQNPQQLPQNAQPFTQSPQSFPQNPQQFSQDQGSF